MRTERQHRIDRAVARVLSNCGDFLQPQETLVDEVGLLIRAPRATAAEVENSIRFMEAGGRIVGVTTETTTKWQITDSGRAWWAQNQ